MKKLFLSFAFVTSTLAFASFPVYTSENGNVTQTNEQVTTKAETATTTNASTTAQKDVVSKTNDSSAITPAAGASNYDKWIAIALWFFLGGLAAHRWYAGKPVGWNILFILTLGGLGIWWVIDLINILSDKFKN